MAQSGPGALTEDFFAALEEHIAEGRVEVILAVRPDFDPGAFPLPEDARIVTCEPDATVPRLRAVGLDAASSRIVALTESFCVPAEGWVDALLAGFEDSDVVAAGGPISRSEGGASQWALTFCEYGSFFSADGERVSDLAGINVAYRKERLIAALGGVPEEIVEIRVHEQLRIAGFPMVWCPSALILDRSVRSLGHAVLSQYHHGRFFGGQRVEGAGRAARLLRALASPIVPVVLFMRIAGPVGKAHRAGQLFRCFPLLAILLAAWAVGEGVGSIFGEGASRGRWL